MAVSPVTKKFILDAYAAWLSEEAKERNGMSGAIFAMRMTAAGAKRYEGLNEQDLCVLVGGDPNATK